MMKKTMKLMLMAIGMIAMLAACSDDDNNEFEEYEKADIFSLVDSETIMLDGVINSKALDEFNALYEENKTVTTINIKNCDGSINDDVNLELSKRVHDLNLNTHLMDNGLIASGGVDFFLAGIKRTQGTSTKIGVHSWSDGSKSATDYPEGNAVHQPYIDYYKYVGFTEAEAKAFYYFTINAASAESIHYMTDAEIAKYKILKE